MQEPRRELADFLKSRRARLLPADVGLPPGGRRRTAGLRREEVAAIAGVGLTWYTFLEQGKDIRVSAPFLENLARALRLTAAERSHLFALAQERLPPLTKVEPDLSDASRLEALLAALDAPAYARSERFDVIAWNGANTRMFGDFAAIPAGERNVVRLLFARGYHRRSMPDWEADARAVLASFRLSFGQAGDKAPFLALIAELERISPDFRRLWAAHDVAEPGEGVTAFCSPRHGPMRFRHHLLRPEAQPGLRIVVYLREEG